ncbi:MAG: ribosomal RNA small subunit methyltransferase A [Alphaproteobacteria bacterium]|nr:ribosomal RNA small subunit methyltransferase A [Alphaproteobacteria bacterium]
MSDRLPPGDPNRGDLLAAGASAVVRAYLDQAAHGHARKRFGQHFLVSDSVLDRIVAAAGVGEGTPVLEIGPGPGALTAALLRAGAAVTAVELDRDCVDWLTRAFPRSGEDGSAFPAAGELRLVSGDAAALDLAPLLAPGTVHASNLPYNVGTRILMRLLGEPTVVRHVVMLQREVAERLWAPVGDRKRGSLSAAVQARAEVSRVCRVPPGSFRPPPKVDSAVALLEPRGRALPDGLDALLKEAFGAPRKTVRNNLRGRFGERLDDVLRQAGVDPTGRPAAVPTDAWIALADLAS